MMVWLQILTITISFWLGWTLGRDRAEFRHERKELEQEKRKFGAANVDP